MSVATVISEPAMIPSQDLSASLNATMAIFEDQIEIESAKCECCGLTEECTPAYINRIRERYAGKWICGLCAEAVKDEIVRSERLLSTEEALARHLNVFRKFRSLPETDPAVHLISAVRQILRRSLESPRRVRSTPASPVRGGGDGAEDKMMQGSVLARAESCFPTIDLELAMGDEEK